MTTTYPNYVRTVLLNQTRGSNLASTLAEEYVSDDYYPRALPATFNKIRGVLFGSNPDRPMYNFRMYQLMQTLHSTELEEYVTQHDDRITYLPFDRDELFASAFGNTVTAASGTAGTLTVLGDAVADEFTGILYHKWIVTVLDGSTVTIRKLAPAAQQSQTAAIYSMTNNLSNAIALPDSAQQFNFSGTAGDEWVIEALANPSRNMADILNTLQIIINDVDQTALFGSTPVEPYLTFSNIWNNHSEYAYQLSALLLAMAFRTMNILPL